MFKLRVCYLLIVLAFGGEVLAQQIQYFRYTNADGVKVIDDQIPPEFIKNGYEVLAPDGRVIREVPRELSEEERRLRNTEESQRRLAEEEQQRLQEWDESLLRRYSSIADIEAAEERAVRDLNIRISILQSNILSLRQQIENLQARAAEAERRGLAVPEEIQQNIEALRSEMTAAEEAITARNGEIEQLRQRYQRDKDRFSSLQEMAEARSRGRSVLDD